MSYTKLVVYTVPFAAFFIRSPVMVLVVAISNIQICSHGSGPKVPQIICDVCMCTTYTLMAHSVRHKHSNIIHVFVNSLSTVTTCLNAQKSFNFSLILYVFMASLFLSPALVRQ